MNPVSVPALAAALPRAGLAFQRQADSLVNVVNLDPRRCAAILLFFPAFACSRISARPLPQQDQTLGPKITVKVNTVLVPVVVRDSQGRPVPDLTQNDFQIFDRGKRQTISGFTVEQHTLGLPTAGPSITSAAAPQPQPASPPPTAPHRFIVFLFDNLHLSAADLLRTQTVAEKFAGESLPPGEMAAVVSTSGANSGLTRDQAVLRQAIHAIQPQSIYHHDDHACPNIDYYQADLIQDKRDNTALQLAEADYMSCSNLVGATPLMVEAMVRSAAAHALLLGEQDSSATLSMVREFIQKMAALPGERTLILISPGFLTITGEAMAEKSHILDLAAASNVTISALDARGLYTSEMDATQRGGSSAADIMTGAHAQYQRDTMNLNEDVMAEFANGSGGIFFHNSNDLEAGFKSLVQGPEYVYLLEFSPNKVKLDGTYHPLKVKVDRKKVSLQARQGYVAAKAADIPTVKPSPPGAPDSSVRRISPPDASPKSPPRANREAPPPPPAKKPENRTPSDPLFWYPIDVDAPLRTDSSAPCPLSDTLQLAGARADEMARNLQNFTAQERLEYRVIGSMNSVLQTVAGTYDYSVVFQQGGQGLAVQENRMPQRGSQPLPAGAQDAGLPEIALLFLSSFQADYAMTCEGSTEWKGQPAWVVHFQQIPDRPSHTAVFSVKGVAYPARLKGRAWIAQRSTLDSTHDSGQVFHLELSLMQSISAAHVRKMYVSIDYGPVQFRTRNVKFWLPMDVTSYRDFGDHRTIVHHTFSDFLLFSVQTDQVIDKPQDP